MRLAVFPHFQSVLFEANQLVVVSKLRHRHESGIFCHTTLAKKANSIFSKMSN